LQHGYRKLPGWEPEFRAPAYFRGMINSQELRPGNTVLLKQEGRIRPTKIEVAHFALLAAGKTADFFPVLLKDDVLLQQGFVENKEYALYPQAREFRRVLAVKGKEHHELLAYQKSNGDCLAWATVNGVTASNPVRHLHQLQNLHHALTGEEL